MKHHYVYRIDHLDSDRFYIGVRTSSVESEKDPYMGSGVWLNRCYEKYGKDRFEKTILATFGSRKDALQFEEVEVDKYLGDPECLNLCRGGRGGGFYGWTFDQNSERQKKLWSDSVFRERTTEAMKKAWSDPARREKQSEAVKKSWQDPAYHKKRSEAIKKSLSDPERRKKQCKNLSEAAKSPFRASGVVHNLERSVNKLKRLSITGSKRTRAYKEQLATVRHYAKKALELTDLTSEQKQRLDAAFIALAELGYTKGNPVIERALRYAA